MKIPLYNKGLGQQVGKTAGQLSPRASFGAFTAVGQATADFAKTAGNIAYEFGMQEKKAEVERLYEEEYFNFSTKADDYNLNSTETDTKIYEDNFRAKVIKPTLNKLDKLNITNKQRQALKTKLFDQFQIKIAKGKQFSFARGQVLRKNAANKSLKYNLDMIQSLDENDPESKVKLAESLKLIQESQMKGLDIDFDEQSFVSNLSIGRIASKRRKASNIKEIDNIIDEIKKSKSFEKESQRETQLTKAETKKTEIITENKAIIINSLTPGLSADGEDVSTLSEAERLDLFEGAKKGIFANKKLQNIFDSFNEKDKAGLLNDIVNKEANVKQNIKFEQSQKEQKEKTYNENLFVENISKARTLEMSLEDIDKLNFIGVSGDRYKQQLRIAAQNRIKGAPLSTSNFRADTVITGMMMRGQIGSITDKFRLPGEKEKRSILERENVQLTSDRVNELFNYFRQENKYELAQEDKLITDFIKSKELSVRGNSLFVNSPTPESETRMEVFSSEVRRLIKLGKSEGKSVSEMLNISDTKNYIMPQSKLNQFKPSKETLKNEAKNLFGVSDKLNSVILKDVKPPTREQMGLPSDASLSEIEDHPLYKLWEQSFNGFAYRELTKDQ